MTKHDVYWPEMGIENDEDTAGSEAVKEWTEHPTLRKVLLTIYLGTEIIRIAAFGAIAGAVLVGAVHLGIDFDSNTAILWGFMAAVAFVMGIDELSKKVVDYSIQYGAFLVATVVVVSLLQLYLDLKERRNSIDDPSALASSLPIESIPLLELYERRNRLM
ncbi:hypothetical protein [Halorussus ruber]|uniref:hypothetical protein n=1 Tax=Halorussus ruber TaxID=1126238 RepID=UPI001092AD55|nr:hypothetical protein [Halorussus ruber]